MIEMKFDKFIFFTDVIEKKIFTKMKLKKKIDITKPKMDIFS